MWDVCLYLREPDVNASTQERRKELVRRTTLSRKKDWTQVDKKVVYLVYLPPSPFIFQRRRKLSLSGKDAA